MIKVEGNIAKKFVSILIDLGSTHSYVMKRIVESCCLIKKKHDKSWLVQLATRTEIKVCKVVAECPLELNRISTKANLNVLPLGSYDTLISMDCLEKHKAKVDCYNNIVECVDGKAMSTKVRGILDQI